MERIVIEVDKKSFLALLERLRREKGLKYSDIAKKLKVSTPYVYYLARGAIKYTLENNYFNEYVNLLIKDKEGK